MDCLIYKDSEFQVEKTLAGSKQNGVRDQERATGLLRELDAGKVLREQNGEAGMPAGVET